MYRKIIITTMSVFLILCSGCRRPQPEREDTQNEKVSDVVTDTVTESAEPEKKDIKKVTWVKEPSMNYDHVSEIFVDNFMNEEYSFVEGKRGYSTEINSVSPYRTDVIAVSKDGKYGICDFEGNEILPVSIPCVKFPSAGLYDLNPFKWVTDKLVVDNGEQWGYLSSDCTEVLYEQSEGYMGGDMPIERNFLNYTDGVLVCKDSEGKTVFFHTSSDDNILVPSSDEYPVYVVADSKGEIVHKGGESLFGADSSTVRYMNGFYPVVYGYGYEWDKLGANKTYWSSALSNSCKHYKIAYANGKTGEPITEYIYNYTRFFNDGYAPVEKRGKWGYINEDGQEVTGFVFDDASALYNGKAYVAVNGYYGIIDLVETLENGVPVNEETVGIAEREHNDEYQDEMYNGIKGVISINSGAGVYAEPSPESLTEKTASNPYFDVVEFVYEIVENDNGTWYRAGYSNENAIDWFKADDYVCVTKVF